MGGARGIAPVSRAAPVVYRRAPSANLGEGELVDKFRGALVGVAVGDALGAPFEGRPGPVPLADISGVERGASRLPYTDDTAMTLALAQSLLDVGDLDEDRLAQAFARCWRSEPHRGYGGGTAALLAQLARGAAWERASRSQFGGQGSFGNGAAMRVAPVALHTTAHAAPAGPLARRSAAVTHAHPLAMDGAAVQAVAVATALAQPPSQPVEPELLLAEVSSAVTQTLFAQRLGIVATLVADSAPEQVIEQLGTGVAAHESVPTAILCFLRLAHSYPDAVRFAVTLGGDTDTIASMAGAIAGAHLGESAIPQRWLARTEGAAMLGELGQRFAAAVVA